MPRSLFVLVAVWGLSLPASLALAAGPSTTMGPPVPRIGGFSDFGFFANDGEAPGATSGFHNGQFVLHLTSALAERFSYFGEVSFTAGDTEFKTEIERSILKFQPDDRIAMSFGRYHTPISWWNAAFHHGLWLQTTVDRPEMTRFGGPFLPIHFVGVVAQGVAAFSGFDLDYETGIGNGRAEPITRDGDAGDVNNDRAWFGTLSVRPDAWYPLEVGGSFYRDLVNFDGGSAREQIATVHLVWPKETPEILAEGAYVGHRDRATEARFDNWAYYVQLAYRLPWMTARLKPYLRVEQLQIDDDDPVIPDSDLTEYTGGVRWDVSDYVALKTEVLRKDFRRGADIDELHLHVSYAF